MGRPAYLILHGYQGSGPGHWQSWLAGRLRAGDAAVRFPDLPDADAPRLQSWLEALERELDAFGEPPIVICHSLACLLWLHHVAHDGKRRASGVLLVAPPVAGRRARGPAAVLPGAPAWRLEHAAARLLRQRPVLPGGRRRALPRRCRPTSCAGRGHINPEAGYGPWPAVEAWARDGPRSRR